MLTKTVQKNNFGGHTWEFKLDSLNHVFMNETQNGSFVIEIKEWKLFSYKTHFSFVSQSDLKGAITETLQKVYEHFLNDRKYSFSMDQKNKKLLDLLNFIELYHLDL
jgi:hypothetical protein